jgi:hypothetical protein
MPPPAAVQRDLDALVERDPRQRQRPRLPTARVRTSLSAVVGAADAPGTSTPPAAE